MSTAGWGGVVVRYRTAFVELALQKFGQSFGMFSAFGVLLNDRPKLLETALEGSKVGFVVHAGLLHVGNDLLE